MKVYYLVYKLTNLVNGKIYIGCHMTKNLDDGYMGSGRRLAYAKKKYGVENFKKEILSTHETPEEMLTEEARLVNEEFLGREDVYNLTVGGKGSWFWVNLKRLNGFCNPELAKQGRIKANRSLAKKQQDEVVDSARRKKISDSQRDRYRQEGSHWTGRTHSDDSKRKIGATNALKQSGELNSQFGTCWIFSEVEKRSIKIKEQSLSSFLELGWKRGRKMYT